jgi:hypothetical protein
MVREMNEQQDKKAYVEPTLDRRERLTDVTEGSAIVTSNGTRRFG